jgi:hypothetical protein
LENYKNSPWFKQDAFTALEMKIQQISAFVIASFLWKIVGMDYGFLAFMIKNLPDPLQVVWGHGPKCILISIWFFLGCLLASSVVKYIFYKIVGVVLGLEPTTPMDDFWLYDCPINPICIPSIITFAKPGLDQGTVEQQWERILSRVEEGHRTRVQLVKRLGKYFIKTTPKQDAQKYYKEHCGILYDVKTD